MTKTPAPDLCALRELAEAATPGPWRADIRDGDRLCGLDGPDFAEVLLPGRVECMSYCYGGTSRIEGDNIEADAAFIAAANPTAVLALLDRIEAAEAAVAYHDDWRYCPRCGRPHDWAGELSPGAPCMVCGRYPANRAALDAD